MYRYRRKGKNGLPLYTFTCDRCDKWVWDNHGGKAVGTKDELIRRAVRDLGWQILENTESKANHVFCKECMEELERLRPGIFDGGGDSAEGGDSNV